MEISHDIYNAIQKLRILSKETQFLYLHKYLFGGGTTFTAHLLHQTRYSTKKNTTILRITKKTEPKLRRFGYGLHYQNISLDLVNKIEFPFITLF
jgi:hypothetical protein